MGNSRQVQQSPDDWAKGHHEMFTAWMRAGFTRDEALDLLREMIGSQVITALMEPQDAA